MGTLVFQATLGGAINLIGPNTASTVNFTLPSADGTSGQALSTNGSGVLSFGTLAVAAGGTGQTSYTNGQLLIGNTTGNTLTKATLTAGTNVTITNAAGAITIAASGGGGSSATPTTEGTVYGKMVSSATATTGLGYNVLVNNIGSRNTAVGRLAAQATGAGSDLTAIGNEALSSNTSGNYNTAVGGTDANTFSPLTSNTTGSNLVAIGNGSLGNNTIASNSTAVGYQALYNNTGQYSAGNTATGYQAGYNNTTGGNLVCIGYRAGYNNTTGNNNVAIGVLAYSGTTGNDSVCIGQEAGKNITTGANNIVIGVTNGGGNYRPVFDITTESNRLVAGHTSVSNAYVQVAWTVVSDARDKTNFAPVPHGLDFVNQLNPVQYQFRTNRQSEETNGPVRYGFKAQEVLALEGANPVIVDNEDSEKLRMTDTYMIPILVKAIQELKAEFDAYKATHP